MNPVDIQRYSYEELRQCIKERVEASGSDLTRTGLCCVNMDKTVTDKGYLRYMRWQSLCGIMISRQLVNPSTRDNIY